MSLHRGFDGAEPLRPEPIGRRSEAGEYRKSERTRTMALGTLACPACDAPVAPGDRALSPRDSVECPYCEHLGRVRDFLSLGTPVRPAVVAVRVVQRVRLA